MAHGFKPGDTAYRVEYDFQGRHAYTTDLLPKSHMEAVAKELWWTGATNIQILTGTVFLCSTNLGAVPSNLGIHGSYSPYLRATNASNYGLKAGDVVFWAHYDLARSHLFTEAMPMDHLDAVVEVIRALGATNIQVSSARIGVISLTGGSTANGRRRYIGDALIAGGA